MKKYYNIFLITLTAFLFGACSNNDEPRIEQDDGMIEISYSQSKFDVSVWNGTRSAELRATQEGTTGENAVDNLYILMFKTDGTDPIKYFVDNAFPTTSGEWDEVNEIVKLKVTQAEAGTRDVYVIANVGSLKGALDGVTNKAGLDALFNSSNTPWSASLGAPADTNTRILMSGSESSHDFQTTRKLESVELIRALAKVELNITLKPEHQSTPVVQEGVTGALTPVNQYHYAFLNFDKNTYVLKPAAKGSNLTAPGALSNLLNPSSEGWSWTVWNSLGDYESVDGNGKVTQLAMVTYINERNVEAGKSLSSIAISMPYNGTMPPPEFGPDVTQIFLPATIERNHWYVYDVEL